MAEKTGYTKAFIDAVLWSYCADGYGQVCTKEPKCDICDISEYCNNNWRFKTMYFKMIQWLDDNWCPDICTVTWIIDKH